DHLGGPVPRALADLAAKRLGAKIAWAHALAEDLRVQRGCVIVGDRQPAAVHALARWIDRSSLYTDCALIDPLGGESLDAMVEPAAVVVIDANPVLAMPQLANVLAHTRSLYAGLWPDETALACAERVPLAHELETWSDPRALDGTVAIAQPVVRPRFEVTT